MVNQDFSLITIETVDMITMIVWSYFSDGTVRIFSSDPSRFASTDELKAYDDLIASSEVPSNLGDIKPEDLSEPEALLNPGKNGWNLSFLQKNLQKTTL